jgi:uncharacterized protein with GYD domain
MATYVILSRMTPGAFRDPADFKRVVASVTERIKSECPGIVFKDSYATLGRFDYVDIIEAQDTKQLEKAIMIMRALGQSETETLAATPFHEFLAGF